MAVILHVTYSKKLGLPQFSSHSCSISIQTEIQDISQTSEESRKLYQLLQRSVDREIENVGFLPEATYGLNGNGHNNRKADESWACSQKQRDLITKIIDDNKLDGSEINGLAQERFGTSLPQLNKLQASGLIEELLSKYSNRKGQNENGNRRRFNRSDYQKEKR
jgi:hypothetical protein